MRGLPRTLCRGSKASCILNTGVIIEDTRLGLNVTEESPHQQDGKQRTEMVVVVLPRGHVKVTWSMCLVGMRVSRFVLTLR